MPTHAERRASRDGYFGPESVIRRVGDSPVLPFLGGGAAVLLQVAHPLVAAGVAAHSDYRDRFWHRFARTMEALYLMVFGSREEADRAGEVVQAVHARVRGRISRDLGPFPAGTAYSASDPDLMLWVHATLVSTSLAVHERFVSRLSRSEEERYYREMGTVARLFGVPAEVVPRTLADFRVYLEDRLSGPTLCVTQPAREVAAAIMRPSLPAPLLPLVLPHRLATAALLPPRLREEYGLAWDRPRAVVLTIAVPVMRAAAVPLFLAAERAAPPQLALAG